MAITMKNPHTIHLAGNIELDESTVASAAITPGDLIERFNNAGTLSYRRHSSAGGGGATIVALERSEFNKTIDDDYAAGDIVKAAVATPGCTFYARVPSGANIAQGGMLESGGNGLLVAASSGVAMFQALESVNNTAGPGEARIRVEAL